MSVRNHRGVIAFVGISYLLAWLCWMPIVFRPALLGKPIGQLLIMPGAMAPAIAAFIVRRWITREGFADARLGIRLRGWRYYLLGLLFPYFFVLVITLFVMALGIGWPNLSVSSALRAMGQPAIKPDLPLLIVLPFLSINAVLATPLLFGEEFGWRGYLQPRVDGAEHPWRAAIVVGIIWGAWHLPLNLNGYNFPNHRLLGVPVFLIGCIFLSYIFGWICERSGSIWASSLAHAALNAIGASSMLMLFPDRTKLIWLNPVGLLGWIPLAATCIAIAIIDRRQARAWLAHRKQACLIQRASRRRS